MGLEDYRKIALEMIIDVQLKFSIGIHRSVGICIDKIDFMILHNPCPINPSPHEKAYHQHWAEVRNELMTLKK